MSSPRERLWTRLAWQRGEDVEETKAAISERGFRQFAAFFGREPPLEEKIDFWMGRLVAAVLAPWQKKSAKEIDPRELIPDWWGERKKVDQPQTVEQWKSLFRNFALMKGGKVVKAGGNGGSEHREPGDHRQRQREAADGGAHQRPDEP